MKRWSPSTKAINAVMKTREELKPYLLRLDINTLAEFNQGYLRYKQNPIETFIDYELNRYIRTVVPLISYFLHNSVIHFK